MFHSFNFFNCNFCHSNFFSYTNLYLVRKNDIFLSSNFKLCQEKKASLISFSFFRWKYCVIATAETRNFKKKKLGHITFQQSVFIFVLNVSNLRFKDKWFFDIFAKVENKGFAVMNKFIYLFIFSFYYLTLYLT